MASATQLRDKLTAVIRRLFREQKKLADGGEERFGDWHNRVQNALFPVLGEAYLWGLKQVRKGKLPPDVVNAVAALAGERAVILSRQLNDTTSEWLQEGKDTSQVFSPERIAQIVMTEISTARYAPQVEVSKQRKEKLRWQVGSDPCPQCRSLNGKVVTPGKKFRSRGGTEVEAPPLHPHCHCSLGVVK